MLKRALYRVIEKAGYNISRSEYYMLQRSLVHFGVDMIIDIGANTGQFSQSMRSSGYKGNIVSYEPLLSAHEILIKKALKDDKWHVAQRCAVGDVNKDIIINVSKNSVSSSVLPMLKTHSDVAISSVYVSKETVKMITLDSVFNEKEIKEKKIFIKIDTQGYEWQVLQGAQKIMPFVCGILCEVSFIELYEGQTMWLEIVEYMQRNQFELWALYHGFSDKKIGRSLQMNAVFYKKNI